MKKKTVLAGLLLLAAGLDAQVQSPPDSLPFRVPEIRAERREIEPARRYLENEAFGVGEELVFDIAYGFIKAGTATMKIPEQVFLNGRACFHVVTTAESNSFFSTFFRVRDTVETFIDTEGIFPWKFEKHIREGHYRADRFVDYQQQNNLVIQNGKDSLYVTDFVQGILSAFYYVRVRDLQVGRHFDIMAYGDGFVYPLRVLIHREETVNVPAGKFHCLVVEPVLQSEGIFNQQGRLLLWLTRDRFHIPVLMKSKALIGSVDCRLRSLKRHKE